MRNFHIILNDFKIRMISLEGWFQEKDGFKRSMVSREGWFHEKDGFKKRMV